MQDPWAFTVRTGSPEDAELIVGHRRAMFFDMG